MAKNVEMPKLDWSQLDQVKAFKDWRDFLESFLIINKVDEEDQWHYIKLSAGSQGKDLWDSWQLTEAQRKDPNTVFAKFADHLVGTQNKWVMRLELAAMSQGESESDEDFVCRLKSKANNCNFDANIKDEQIVFQLIKGIKWSEARRKLISKGNDLKLKDAIEIAQNFQATLSNTSSFEKSSSVNAMKCGRSRYQQQNKCKYCGTSHVPKKCPAYGKNCHKCGRMNHFGNVCQNKRSRSKSCHLNRSRARSFSKSKERSENAQVHASQVVEEGVQIHFDDTPINCGSIQFDGTNISAITNSKGERQVILAKLDVKPPNITRRVTLTVKADTGSNGNILPVRCLRQMYPHIDNNFNNLLKPTCDTLTAVNDTLLKAYGTIEIPTSLDKSPVLNLHFYVCDTNGPAIISCDASERLGIIEVKKSKSISSIKETYEMTGLLLSQI